MSKLTGLISIGRHFSKRMPLLKSLGFIIFLLIVLLVLIVKAINIFIPFTYIAI